MLRMSGYASASLRPGGYICTPCRLLIARRTAAASLPVVVPRLLNLPRLRTYSDKAKPVDEAINTPTTSDSAAPKTKKKKKKKKPAASVPPAEADQRSDSDITMIQEALRRIKTTLYGSTDTPDTNSKATAAVESAKAKKRSNQNGKTNSGKERDSRSKKDLKSKNDLIRIVAGRSLVMEPLGTRAKANKPSAVTLKKDITPEEAKAQARKVLTMRKGEFVRKIPFSKSDVADEKTEQEPTPLAQLVAKSFGKKSWDESQITPEDRAQLMEEVAKFATREMREQKEERIAAKKKEKTAGSKKEKTPKVSPLLGHLDQPPPEGKETGKGKKSTKKGKNVADIMTVHAKELELTPIEREQPPVPGLTYGLDRVLFNPGVYHMQDPRSKVYNFDPYLAGIMPVKEFDFNALKQYVTSSKDTTLIGVAAEHGKKYAGSTSSMTSMLAHFHYLLSSWRPINTDHLTRSFPVDSTTFTAIQRSPAAIFLHYKDGTYAIDADKEFDTANVLSMLGKSMEKLLTLPKEDFEKYRRVNSAQLTEEERNADESYHYTTMGDFMMRSQLDAHDPRIPGTGMFDLKTRAVVSIRMDARDYLKGVGYEIRQRFGRWESYEREYYDMIRSAFLKYSLQVRMGRMDGIFVAFHNTQRIFGFQYIPLAEMDQSLHGTSDTTLGHREFKLSLHLLNKLLDRATEKWPKQSLRLHFETRPSETPFMYIFATPVTPEQIEKVQTKNKAAVELFEREMMGLVREEDDAEVAKAGEETTSDDIREEAEEDAEEEEEDEEEETSLDVWEDMRTKVEETLENDELGADFVRDVMEDALEESGLLRTGSHDEKESYLDAIMEVITIGSKAEGSEESVNKATGELSMGEDGQVEDKAGEQESVEVATSPEPEESAAQTQPESNAETDEGYESETKEEPEEKEAITSEEAANANEPSLKDLIIRLANKSRASPSGPSGSPQEPEDDLSSDEQRLRKFEHILYQMVEKTQQMKTSSATTEPSQTSDDAPSKTKSQSNTINSSEEPKILAEDAAEETLDALTPSSEVLGMILTLRNKVNGQYVSRPEENFDTKSHWTVEYAIEELPQDRAKALYQSCIVRRKKALGPKPPRSQFDAKYRETLHGLSDKGREWRLREMEKAKQRPVHVYGMEGSLKWDEVFKEDGEPMAESLVGKER